MEIILYTYLTNLTTVSHKTFFLSYKGQQINYKSIQRGRVGGGGASKSTIFSVIDMYKA